MRTIAHDFLSISLIVITRLQMPPIRDYEVDSESAEDDGEHSHSTILHELNTLIRHAAAR